jgi:hypothetical protein
MSMDRQKLERLRNEMVRMMGECQALYEASLQITDEAVLAEVDRLFAEIDAVLDRMRRALDLGHPERC